MSAKSLVIPATGRSTGRRRARVLTTVVGVLSALVIWAIAEYGFDLDLHSPAFNGGDPADVGAVQVVGAALVGSLAGWALLALLEHVTSRAVSWWVVVAIIGLLVSLGGPLGGSGITASNRWTLALMHVVVGAVVIIGFARSSRR